MHVTLLTAQSLDGFIARHGEAGSGFASPEDQRHFHSTLAGFDCCIMGSVTYRGSRASFSGESARNWLRMVLTRSPEAYTGEAKAGALEFTDAAPEQIVTQLRRRGYKRCVLLGGGQIYGMFLAAKQVDELWLTLEPLLFGQGTPLVGLPVDIRLELVAWEKLNPAGTLLLRYRAVRAISVSAPAC